MSKVFAVPFADRALATEWHGAEAGSLLLLHGAGTSCKAHWRELLVALSGRGLACAAFDFIGHGETGGDLSGSCLASRLAQTLAVVAELPRAPRALLGASMGAYVALRALEHLPGITRLVLVVPGVYAPSAFDLPFGPAFSAEIRKPASWAASDAFERVAAFAGRTLILATEQDQVIPRAIPERLAAEAREAELVWLPGGHRFSVGLDEKGREAFRSRIADFLLS
ncbi:alpha/beta fold hydrolase [Niveibacterium terrae]|uniref:alpha/beta fold hydrolase n=1 Tax=Niveibacterium terrae TaxID=3373598 RepID=UPI003A9385B3